MAATYVTVAELALDLGIGSLVSNTILEEVCQAAENIIKDKLEFNKAYIAGVSLTSNVATITTVAPHGFNTGQSVTLTLAPTVFTGAVTITAAGAYTFTFAKVNADIKFKLVRPTGVVTGAFDYTDYATIPEINEASLMIAVDIFQARQTSNSGGTSVDMTPSPYRMGSTLLSRVRGLISSYLAPSGMLG